MALGPAQLKNQGKRFVIESQSGGRNQRYGGKSLAGLGKRATPLISKHNLVHKSHNNQHQPGSDPLDMGDINDMNMFEKMILSKSFKKKRGGNNGNSRYTTEDQPEIEGMEGISLISKGSNRYSTQGGRIDPGFDSLVESKKIIPKKVATGKSR